MAADDDRSDVTSAQVIMRLDALAAEHEALVAAHRSQAAELRELRSAHDALLTRVGSLQADERSGARTATADPQSSGTMTDASALEGSGGSVRNRRDVLRRAGVAAAGALAVGSAAALGTADPAAAANGGNLVLGQTSTADSPTALAVATPTNAFGLGVTDVSLGSFPYTGTIAGHNHGNYNAAVFGYDDSTFGKIAVMGRSDSGSALYGLSTTGTGVYGLSADGYAAILDGAISLLIVGTGTAPPTRTDHHLIGEVHCDSSGDLWYCVSPGSPGVWRRLAGSSTAGSLSVLDATARIYDSRAGLNPLGVQKGRFADHEERVIDATIGGAVSPGATAVLINATATNTNPGGFFAFFKNGITWPKNSSLNWGLPNSTIANLAVVAVDAQAKFKAHCEGAGGADLVIDCIGYFR